MANIKKTVIKLILLGGITWSIVMLINLGAYDLKYLFILVIASVIFGYLVGRDKTPTTHQIQQTNKLQPDQQLERTEYKKENIDERRVPEEFKQENERFKKMKSNLIFSQPINKFNGEKMEQQQTTEEKQEEKPLQEDLSSDKEKNEESGDESEENKNVEKKDEESPEESIEELEPESENENEESPEEPKDVEEPEDSE